MIRHIDPAQKNLQFHYDHSGRLVERLDAMGHSVRFRYDAYGRLLKLTNENDESYRFGWDKLDRLVAQEDLDGSGHIYEYDVLDGVTTFRTLPKRDRIAVRFMCTAIYKTRPKRAIEGLARPQATPSNPICQKSASSLEAWPKICTSSTNRCSVMLRAASSSRCLRAAAATPW